MKTKRQFLGRWGESVAASYLSGKGYQILRRNVRTPYGEIDLVAIQNATFVFVEVRTRSTSTYGFPEDSITTSKQQHMQDAAQYYLVNQLEEPEGWRIDVVAIRGFPGGPDPEIIHYENAISGD
jgi:putative endonuclease